MDTGHELVRDRMDEQIVRCVMHKKIIAVTWFYNLQMVNRVMDQDKRSVQ